MLRKIVERLEERAVGSDLDDLYGDLVRYPLHDDAWRHQPGLAASLGALDGLVDDLVDLAEAREPVVEVLNRDKAQAIGRAVEVLYAATLAEGQQVVVELEFVDVVLQQAPKQLVVEAILLRQGVPVDRVGAPQEFARVAVALFDGGDAGVRPLAVEAAIAHHRGHQRGCLQAPFPVLVEQCLEVRCRIRVRNSGCCEQPQSESNSGRFHSNSLICRGGIVASRPAAGNRQGHWLSSGH